MIAPAAAAAMAALIIESENFSRMMIPFCLEPKTGVDGGLFLNGPMAWTQVSGHAIRSMLAFRDTKRR
jgi:hypothetical protein